MQHRDRIIIQKILAEISISRSMMGTVSKEDFLQKFEKVLKKSEELAGEENLNIDKKELTRQEKKNIRTAK